MRRILSQDANGRLVINGRISQLFWLFRSVCQGCPLAPTLFILVTDLLLRMVKLNVRIKGLIDPVGRELKLSIFADDTLNMVLRELATLIALMAVLELFCILTGLHINWQKTVAISAPDNAPLPGPCSHIRVLQAGESAKYVGFPSSLGKEDIQVARYVQQKVLARCL